MNLDPDTDVNQDGAERLNPPTLDIMTLERHQNSRHQLIITTLIASVLAITILILDLSMPLGVAGGVPYVALVLVGWWFPKRLTIFILAVISSVLVVVGYYYSPEGGIAWVVLTNRAYALFAIWITAIILWVARRSRALVLQSEASIKHAMQKAEVANVAKSEFLATVSHELRTPLNAINGFTGSILHETFGPISNDKYKEYIEDIQHSGNHLTELINDLLDVSAIEAGKLELHEENLDVGELIERATRLVAPRSEKRNVTIRPSIQDALPPLYADRRRLQEILLNILSNAIKFSHEGGEISLDVQIDKKGWMAFTISDKGIGMDARDILKAMETFGQVDSSHTRKFEGTGLGLPLTKALIGLHGGTLDLDSNKGVGTSVIVKFPNERVGQNVS